MLQYMHLNKKSQSSFEFIIVTGIVMVFLVLILTLVVNRTQEFEQTKTELFTKSITENIEKEIYLARTLPSGYTRTFNIPREIDDKQFNFSIIKGKELVVKTNDQFEYLSFLPQTVYGEIGPGNNKLIKRGSQIGLCYEKFTDFCNSSYENTTNKLCYCYNVFPSGTDGSLQCLEDDTWVDCEFSYGDTYEGIRAQCLRNAPEIKNVSLEIQNLDYVETIYEEVSTTYDEYDTNTFEFLTSPKININKSGNYKVSYTCESTIGTFNYYVEYDVPYGFYQVIFKGIVESDNSCSKVGTNNYTCDENETFDMRYEIRCMQGDCGNTTVWLDP